MGRGTPLHTIDVARFTDLAQARAQRDIVVLDVRRLQEWQDSHIGGAVHVPLHELLDRIDDVPDGEVWVHCGAGYRASLAASLLAARGRTAVAVDDEFDKAAESGLELERPAKVAA
jgi:rhodanese-related sulfurtransferase